MLGRFFSRPRPRRRSRPTPLFDSIEALEDRTLLSGAAVGAMIDVSDLKVDDTSYSSTEILVKWNTTAADGGQAGMASLADSLLPGAESRALSPSTPALQKITLPTGIDANAALELLRQNPLVEYAELDYRVSIMVTPNDPQYGQMWDLENAGQTGGTADADIDASAAWETHTGSGATIVAVTDTGIDYTHPDLAANIWINIGEIAGDGIDNDGNGYVDDVHGYDFINHDGDPMDDQGHGTHVAGTIGAVGNNGIGITGINWNVQLMALKFLGADGSGSQSDAIEAVLYAVNNGAHVINASWGGDPFSQILKDALETARDEGVIFVAAAGNGNFLGIGQNNDQIPFYPANYNVDNVVSVAATDHDDNLAFFSNYGATTVDLAAPGVDILSTLPGGGYGLSTGTSMAAPHVTGVIALIRDRHPDWTYQQIISQVLNTVDPLPGLQGLTVTGGRLNAGNALPPERPEIRVLFNGADVTDGVSNVDIGHTLRDVPLDATFTVTNIGTEDVLLDSVINLPAGFVLVSGFTQTTLAYSQSTTFTIRLQSPVVGTFGGAVSFGNNDEDEGPFDFSITGEVSNVAIIDNGDAGFTPTGATWGVSGSGGFEGDHHYNAAGTGADKAEWTFAVAPGAYRVAVTWLAGENRATNAPFTVLDGTTVLTNRSFNQELPPNDFTADGGAWESLGEFLVTGNTLTVRLTDAANEFVIADAVRLERIEPAPEIAVTLNGMDVLDDTGSVDFGAVLIGDAATRTFTVTNTGLASLSLSGPIGVPEGFTVVESFTETTLAPGESTTFVIRMDATAVGSFSGEVSFANSDDDEDPFNFAVSGSVGDVAIIDNGAAGFSVSGPNWGASNSGGFAGDHHFNNAGTGSEFAEWTFSVAPGAYEVAVSWLAGLNRATNAPFTVLDGTTVIATLSMNQELTPDDFTADGGAWERLGQFNINGDTLTVRLTDAANEFVIADAVRVTPVSTAPEILVTVNGNDVPDGSGSVSFGQTLIGSAVSRTVTVTNVGTDDLLLSGPITLPAGFSLVQSFSATTLAPQQSSTFVIQLDATLAGSYGGEVSFTCNDADECPYNFTITGTVSNSAIVDNGDAGFTLGGSNWGASGSGGFAGDHHYNAAGTGADTAQWTFTVAPGTYAVAATWLAGLNRATNAPFTILDGTTPVATVNLNQELAPNDFSADGAAWERLGEFNITSGTLTVRLSDAANEFVIADAIRVEPVVSAPEIEVTVNGSQITDGSGSVNFGQTLTGSAVARTFTVTNAGAQDLVLTGPITLPAGFSLVESFGATTLAAGESTTFIIQFDAAAEGSFSGAVSFGTNDSDEDPFNFTISGTVSNSAVIDNGDPGFTLSGAGWGASSNGGFAGDHHYNAAGTGADTAEWTFAVAPGTYQVAAAWLAGANRATNATYTILDGTTVLGTVFMNQELAPNDFTADGGAWENLGEFTITSGALTVRLSDAANEFVIADAIRVSPAPTAPEIQVTINGNQVSDGGGFVDFGQALVGNPTSRTITVTNVGSATLSLNEPITLPAGFSLVQSFTSTSLAPGESTTFVIQLDAAGQGGFSGEVSFGNNDADEGPFNFTVSGTVSDAVIVDNGGPGFTVNGTGWGASSNGGFQGDHHYNAAGTGADTAEWTFSLAPGTYQVSASWLAGVNRATNAPFTILDGTTVLATVTVNQEQAPNDFTASGGNWEILGEFTITSGTLTVRLSDAANEFVIADAIRVAPAAGASAQGDFGDGGETTVQQRGFHNEKFTPPRDHLVRHTILSQFRDWFGERSFNRFGRVIAAALRNARR